MMLFSWQMASTFFHGESSLFWKGADMAKSFSPLNNDGRKKLILLAKITEPAFKLSV